MGWPFFTRRPILRCGVGRFSSTSDEVQDLQQVLWAKAEGIEGQTCLDLLKRT